MNSFNWIPWLLAICLCMTEARYKMRRPLPPSPLPPPQIFKKSWPIAHRMSMGNTIHIGNNYPPKRPIFNKPNHYRLRPPPMFNVPPTQWKNPIPVIAPIQNIAVIPQRTPVKEFAVMKKVPEYSPEYRPELIALPQTHRGDIDDDRGPIHTIPAPNLSLADKPYHTGEENNDDNSQGGYRRLPNDNEYNSNGSGAVVTNYGFGDSGTSAEYQRPVTNPTPSQNSYEVTKMHDVTNEFQTVVPTFFPAEFDSSRLVSSGPTPDVQTNELYLNHPPVSRSGMIDTNMKFGHSNIPMQTNLQSSLHVGFPGSGAQAPSMSQSQMSDIHVGHQAPDLHVGHPAASGPPLSANQLYDLLNSFPQPLVEQYTTDQQPQLQQHLLQQQLDQLMHSETNPTTFSQPQMHSFNYDEQAAKQQQQQQQQQQLQQQILFGQDYASGRVTADYNLAPESPTDVRHNAAVHQSQDLKYQSDNSEQTENNIEYDEQGSSNTVNQAGSENYFSTVGNNGVSIATQFYTTLPNRETAEKLAALAAAGNVNSHLIGQLKKQQQRQKEQEEEQRQQDVQKFNDENLQNDEPLPANHNYQVNEQVDDIPHEVEKENLQQPQRLRYGSQKRYRQRYRQQQIQQEQEVADKHYEQQKFMQEQREQEEEQKNEEIKRPLRIMVPEVEDDNYRNFHSSDSTNNDYEYDNTDSQSTEVNTTLSHDDSTSAFGSRIRNKSDM
ncbi:hypothetical protein PV327_001891 [Microctonus hyperodae]|uniref:Uncharacterized protein n=1 Tax=Microctonus hyperodae TaxID=165561 RepID=A0AA39FEF2_MICHY|nr:hypothetical protein PV327_001891 [Microctonus hyperodae]